MAPPVEALRDGDVLRVDRRRVEADEAFVSRETRDALLAHHRRKRAVALSGGVPAAVERINALAVPEGALPEELSHQDLSGRESLRQARHIRDAAFLRAVVTHPEYRDLPGFEAPKRLMEQTLRGLALLRRAGNFFRRDPVHTVVGSTAEVQIATRCMGSLWPAGVDLYGILREMYPAFHARITGQIPAVVAARMESLLDETILPRQVRGVGRYTIDAAGRFLGLYPVVAVPAAEVTLDAPLVSQDQLGRKEIAASILADLTEATGAGADRACLVVDYAGGVGNLAELVLQGIQSLPDRQLRARLIDRVRIVVVDASTGQLAGGRSRFRTLAQRPDLAGIERRILFLEGDVTRPLAAAHREAIRAGFGDAWADDPVHLGMTSYTLGALDNVRSADGQPVSMAMADAMHEQCWKMYAVDFSSPLWRVDGFLDDTGRWGHEYLRTVHGRAGDADERAPLAAWLRHLLRLRHGRRLTTVAEFVRFMSIGGALAAHYATVWPGIDGHSAGYSVQEDGQLRKPAILSFAERLHGRGATLDYRSKVRLFATLDLGAMAGDTRAWACVPGWLADFVSAENPALAPSVTEAA